MARSRSFQAEVQSLYRDYQRRQIRPANCDSVFGGESTPRSVIREKGDGIRDQYPEFYSPCPNRCDQRNLPDDLKGRSFEDGR